MAELISGAELASRVPDSLWTENADRIEASILDQDDQRLTVVRFGRGRKALVLEQSGQWLWTSTGADGGVSAHRLEEPEVVGAMPLLELTPERLAGRVAGVADRLGLSPAELIAALPLSKIVEAALDTHSDYWVECALNWLEARSLAMPPLESMQMAAADKAVGQHLRQRLRRILSASA